MALFFGFYGHQLDNLSFVQACVDLKNTHHQYMFWPLFFSFKTFIEKNIIAMVCRRVHKYGRIKYMNYGFPFLRV